MQYWPKTQDQKKQALAFAIGEGTSYFSAPGALLFCEDVLPDQMDSIKRSLSKSIVEPNLKFFENISSWFGTRERISKSAGYYNPSLLLPSKEQRAYKIADSLVKFGVANFLGGSLISFGVQTASEKVMKTPEFPAADKIKMRVTEFAGHYGSAIILGTIFSPFADRAKDVIAKIMQGVGVSKKDSDNIGFATVYTVIPEIVGTLTGYLTMTGIMGKGGSFSR